METKQEIEYKMIAVAQLENSPYNVRQPSEKDESIDSLARSIQRDGILHPLIVNDIGGEPGNRKYEIIAGSRRFAAAKKIGLIQVPCSVVVASKDRGQVLSFVENIQREDLSAIQRARVIEKIVAAFSGNKQEVAFALGFKTASVINDWLAPLDIDPEALNILKPVAGQTITKRASLIASLPKINQKAAAEILNEKAPSEYEARKIVTAIKQNPTEEPRVVVERIQSMPQLTSVLIQVTPNVNKALEQACVDLNLTKAKLAEKALEEFLISKQYLLKEAGL